MQRFPSRAVPWAAALVAALVAAPSWARTTFHDLEVFEAVHSDRGVEKLLDVPYYMAGQTHPAVVRDLGVFTANRRTNAFNKADQEACRIAFLSALISLQNRARELGADAVIDIESTTKHNDLTSATRYRCAAGNLIANVVLTGRMVTFE